MFRAPAGRHRPVCVQYDGERRVTSADSPDHAKLTSAGETTPSNLTLTLRDVRAERVKPGSEGILIGRAAERLSGRRFQIIEQRAWAGS